MSVFSSSSPSTRPPVSTAVPPGRMDQNPPQVNPPSPPFADAAAVIEMAKTAFDLTQRATEHAQKTIIPELNAKMKEFAAKELQAQTVFQNAKVAVEEKARFEAERKMLEDERKAFVQQREERLRKDDEERVALLQKSNVVPVPKFLSDETAKEVFSRVSKIASDIPEARQVRMILAALATMDELQDANLYMQLLARLYLPLKNLEQRAGPLIEDFEKLINQRKDLGFEVKAPKVNAPYETSYMNAPSTTKFIMSVSNWAVIKDGSVKIRAEVR